jgi:hypothetical protein
MWGLLFWFLAFLMWYKSPPNAWNYPQMWSTYEQFINPLQSYLLGSLMPIGMLGVVIWVCAKHTRCADGKCLATAKVPRTYCNGGSCISAAWWIWINDAVCKAAWKQLSYGKLQFYFNMSCNLILNKRLNKTIIGMDIRYLIYSTQKPNSFI